MVEESFEQQWDAICAELKETSDDSILREWLDQISPSIRDDALVLSVPNRFMRDWLKGKEYDSAICHLFQKNNPAIQRVEVCMQDFFLPSVTSSSEKQEVPVCNYQKPASSDIVEVHLNPEMTFENYVVGSSNELAAAAAKGVTQRFESSRNPLFLHSSVGLGKTHLMNAIAWKLKETQPQKKVLYLSAEQFMYQYVRALRSDKTGDCISDFRDLFRSADVLMIDDVQFICGKQGTQTEFFHTFNSLIEQGKQIVLSSDSSPLELKGLEERLKTRMAQGLIVDIYPTTYEMRIGILQSKAAQWGIDVPMDVVEFLAEHITGNVRELEGALKRLGADSQLLNKKITLASTQSILKDVLNLYQQEISVADIQKAVCDYFVVSLSDLKSSRRDRSIARPRQIAMYLAKELTSKSLPEIGLAFGRDHTTILHAIRLVEDLVKSDATVAEHVTRLKRSFKC